MVAIDKTFLLQGWLHSHEEDSGELMVFRPDSHSFPPSRGRYGFVLKAGGVMASRGPSAGDASSEKGGGSWSLRDSDLLLEAPGENRQHYTIEEVCKDKLVLRPVK